MELASTSYKRHIFVCINEREPSKPCCGLREGPAILKVLKTHVVENGLTQFKITKTKCLGHCKIGPTIAVYPDGKIFTNVKMDDIPQIIREFLT